MINISNLTYKTLLGSVLLDDVSLQINDGEMFGVLGHNGAGKTTLIKLIVGLNQPTSGSINYAVDSGETYGPQSSVLQNQIGFVPEQPVLPLFMTSREYLEFHGALAKKQVDYSDTLKRVHLPQDGRQLIATFSKGMQQRLSIAQALLHKPRYLICDEPMSGLDPVARRQLREIFLDLNRVGITIVFSTHILQDVESLCDRIAYLKKGRLVKYGVLSSVFEAPHLSYEVHFNAPLPPTIYRELNVTPRNIMRGVAVEVENEKLSLLLSEITRAKGEVYLVHPRRSVFEESI